MSRFAYAAVLETGRRVEGVVRSRSPEEATRRLLEMGYHPVRVEEVDGDGESSRRPWRRVLRRVSTTDLAVFTRQLGTLLRAGLPMLQALGTMRKQCASPALAAVVESIEESLVQDAGSFSDALDEFPDVFSPVYRGLVRSGEESGTLPDVLVNLAKHLGASARLRGQVLGAFVYPAFLVVLGTGAVFVLMTFVIPKFEELFRSFGQNLPWPTAALIVTSHFMAAWWWALLAGIAAAGLLARLALRRPALRERFDRRLLALPFFGAVVLKVEVARVSHTFAALLNAGIPILNVIRVTRETARNLAMRRTFDVMLEGVSSGDTLAASMERAGIYPPLVVNLVRTGEDTGELPEMLREVASIYEDEAERAIIATVKLLEPLLILVMGGVIACIVAAVILPIFRANTMVAT